ncbi:NUDIX domain-containing protein [Nonomuraea sp. NPDC050227]|uniref:NUDIX domain-containing protein n=1 Tax=Nonomuraea sp. NPDC050227 TaxID=3364360 RepID=UPI0037ABCA88
MSTPEPFRPHVGVHLILIEGDKVLLLLRANTGFADGLWSVPGGCLDAGETLPEGAAREAREELGIDINPADLDFAGVCHHADPDGQARIGVFFATSRWGGEPVNAEPSKCDKIEWFPLDDLPGDVVSYIRAGLGAYQRGDAFSLDGWQRRETPARDMNLYRPYFDLVSAGRKSVEVRVLYSNLRDLAAGQRILFRCDGDECLTKVVRVAVYDSFEELLDTEGPERVNPDSSREQQLANIRRIYGPEKEALGVLAIEIERVQP